MLDIRALCQEYNIPLIESGHHHAHQGWIQIHCPFCTNGSHGWHLGFSLERGSFNCWRCGSHRVWDTLIKILRGEDNARKALSQFQTDVPRPAAKQKARKRTLWKPDGMGPLEKVHYKYLIKRRFDPDELEREWDLKGTVHASGKWNWRIVFPIRDREGLPVAYLGRAVHDDTRPKYKMSDDKDITVDPKQLLYGIHKVEGDTVIVVEGPTDVWRLGPGAVALLGIDWKMEQANLLRFFDRRVIMFDPDPQAQSRAAELADWLGMYSGETELVSELHCDPGDMEPDEARDLMDSLMERT